MSRSLISGKIERNARTAGSLCDAIITPQPGDLTFPILKRLCGPGIAVSDDEALHAMALAFARLKIVRNRAAPWRWPRRCSTPRRSRTRR